MVLFALGILLALQFIVLVVLGHEIRERDKQVKQLSNGLYRVGTILRQHSGSLQQLAALSTQFANALTDVQDQIDHLPDAEFADLPDNDSLH